MCEGGHDAVTTTGATTRAATTTGGGHKGRPYQRHHEKCGSNRAATRAAPTRDTMKNVVGVTLVVTPLMGTPVVGRPRRRDHDGGGHEGAATRVGCPNVGKSSFIFNAFFYQLTN